MQLSQFVLSLIQAKPPPIPPTSADGEGNALIFLLLLGIVFFVVAAIIIGVATVVMKAVDAPASIHIPVLIAGLLVSGVTIWYFWEPLVELLGPVAEWTWIGMLLVFGLVAICVVVAMIVSGLKTQFSRENIAGTVSLIGVGALTAYLYNAASWSFWSALGVSFGVVLLVNVVIVGVWKFAFEDRDQR